MADTHTITGGVSGPFTATFSGPAPADSTTAKIAAKKATSVWHDVVADVAADFHHATKIAVDSYADAEKIAADLEKKVHEILTKLPMLRAAAKDATTAFTAVAAAEKVGL